TRVERASRTRASPGRIRESRATQAGTRGRSTTGGTSPAGRDPWPGPRRQDVVVIGVMVASPPHRHKTAADFVRFAFSKIAENPRGKAGSRPATAQDSR